MTVGTLRAAALLADPERSDNPGGSAYPGDPAGVVQVLRANKVPLVEIAAGGIAGSTAWKEALAQERLQRDQLAGEFAMVSAALAANGITPVLFKSAGGLPYRSSNLDLLVRPAQMDRAAVLLEELGHLRFPHYREDHKLLFRRFRSGRSVICVHLHDAVSWGKILILPGDDVVTRSRAPLTGEIGFRIASSEDLLLIALAHSLYETDQLRLSDVRALRLSLGDPSFRWTEVLARVQRRGWLIGFSSILVIASKLDRTLYGKTKVPDDVLEQAEATLARARWARRGVDRLTSSLDSGPPALPYPLSKFWSKIHAAFLLMRTPDRAPDERIADLFSTAASLLSNRLGWRCRPPILVSVTGLDGSGKSSAIGRLGEAMTLCEIPTRVVWSRGGFTHPMQKAKRAARSMMGARLPGPDQSDAKRRWLSGRVGGATFAALVVIEQAVHYLLRVRAPRWAGKSILCDRFAHDTVADLEAKLGARRGLARAAGALVLAVAPEPDLAILLRLDPLEAARRKPDDAPLTVLKEQAATLDRVAAMCGLRVVDAGRSDDEVSGEIVDMVLRQAFARFAGAQP